MRSRGSIERCFISCISESNVFCFSISCNILFIQDCWSIIAFVSKLLYTKQNYAIYNNSIKIKTTALTLASLSALSQVALADYDWQFGKAFSTGPVATNSFIRESHTTLVLPKVSGPQTGNLALWPGMGTSGGDLVQALAISVVDGSAGCLKAYGL